MKMLVTVGTIAHMGGAERQALYLVGHLSGLPNCRVEVLTFEDGTALRPELEAFGVPVHVHPYYFRWPRGKRAMSLARLAWRLRSQIKPDALLPFVGIHSKAMAQVWPYSGARFCWWNQQDEGRDLHGTLEERRILEKVSCITSNSEAGKEFLAKTYRLHPDSILVYNNGTPLPDLPYPNGGWKERLGLTDRKVASMIANVTGYKDHRTLFEAWTRVRDHFPAKDRPVLLLAGHLRDQKTVAELKIRGFELGLSASDIRFLGPVEDVGGLVSESDLVVHSSLTEGCPNAVCEAMALGKAVVATDIPGCRQALGPCGTPWLSPPEDAIGLAEKIIHFLDNPTLAQKTGIENRQRIASEFSIEGMNRFFQDRIETGLCVKLGEPMPPLAPHADPTLSDTPVSRQHVS